MIDTTRTYFALPISLNRSVAVGLGVLMIVMITEGIVGQVRYLA